MVQVIIKLLAMLIVFAGVILIFDARKNTKKHFGFGDQNEATFPFKLLGFILSVIGGILFYII